MTKGFEDIIQFTEEEIPFNKYLGIKVDELRKGVCAAIHSLSEGVH